MTTSCIGCKHYDKKLNEEPCVSCVDCATSTRTLFEPITGKMHSHTTKMPERYRIVNKDTYYATEKI
jgi:hypothetical protein